MTLWNISFMSDENDDVLGFWLLMFTSSTSGARLLLLDCFRGLFLGACCGCLLPEDPLRLAGGALGVGDEFSTIVVVVFAGDRVDSTAPPTVTCLWLGWLACGVTYKLILWVFVVSAACVIVSLSDDFLSSASVCSSPLDFEFSFFK